MCNQDLPGKLKKTTNVKCPNCYRGMLQIRTIETMSMEEGEEILIGEDIICCSKCGEEFDEEVIKLKTRRKRVDSYQYGYL